MIHVFRWDPATKTLTNPSLDDLAPPGGEDDGTAVWIDLDDPTPEEEERVFGRLLPVHTLTRGDITRPRRATDPGAHLPKVEEFPDYLLVIANPLPADVCGGGGKPAADPKAAPDGRGVRCRWVRPQLSAVLTHTLLVTHHYDPLPSVAAVRETAARRAGCVARGPDYLLHLILDEMVDEYAPVVERFADRLDRIESRLFARPSRRTLTELLRLKRQVVFLRKTLTLEREVLARLVRGEFALVSDREIAYYRNVYDHLVRYTELVEGAREMASDLMQMHQSATANRLNEIVKVLTMISTIILPMTLIAGVYGMNFERSEWPDYESSFGFGFAVGLMLLTLAAGLLLFRWKKWL